jgi:WD repeat-containing protein 23
LPFELKFIDCIADQIEAGDVGWSIMDIDFSSDGRYMLFATSQNVQIASIDDNEAQTTVDIEEVTAFGARFAPNGTDVLFGCRNGHLILFDTQARTLLMHAPDAHQDDINAVSFVGDSSFVFASASDDSLCKVHIPIFIFTLKVACYLNSIILISQLWDTRASTSRSQGGFIGHTRGLTSVCADTSNLLLTNGKDHTARLWDIRRLASVSAMQSHVSDNAADLARFDYRFNWRNGRAAAPTRPHNSRRVADQALHTFVGHSVAQTLIRANFSPASTGHAYVYSGSSTGDVFVWSTLSGELVDVLHGCHQAIVRECHWHPTLPMMGTASWDGHCAKLAFHL